jgi:tRNA G10  N-methylase Trm11
MTKDVDNVQSRYVFVSGKNWKLSLAELTTFLGTTSFEFKIDDYSRSFFSTTVDRPLDPSIIDRLGGTIKIGISQLTIPLAEVRDAFLRRNKQSRENVRQLLISNKTVDAVFSHRLETSTFGVSVYVDDHRLQSKSGEMQRFFGSYFKKGLAARGERSSFMGYPKGRRQQQLTHVEVLKKELIEKSGEVLFCLDGREALLAKTIGVHNPFEFQKRDVDRPCKRRIFSIPPRLARIMVNLSRCRSGSIFLDPFAGVGTILQEAALAGAEIMGVDIDPWCINSCMLNLNWLRKEYGLRDVCAKFLVGDARRLSDKIQDGSVDCIATEPDLGPPLRHLPAPAYASKVICNLKPLYWGFLAEAYRVLKNAGYLVLVSPWIKTRDRSHVSLDLSEKAEALGFKVVFPFTQQNFKDSLSEDLIRREKLIDVEERHKIGREIHVFRR